MWKSNNQHGVHSPFVYSLLTKCVYNKTRLPSFQKIKTLRKELMSDSRIIQVTDFGAGSKVFRSNTRKISAIAQNAGISQKRSLLLNKLCRYFKIENALELGTSVGLASAAIAMGNNLKLTTIEGCPETAKIANEYFERYGLDNIHLKVGDFNDMLEKITQSKRFQLKNHPNKSHHERSRGADLIYFDGNHQKEATLSYFNKLLPLAHNDSIFIVDDIHWSPGMEAAWEQIKNHPKVTVTIDGFFWGLVFFRKEQEKEHFVIRL